ncbi:MAG TPA: gentisate 1,2-dioxygenase [Sphingomonas sp.]|uniref:gentisate 1,2-dioxygenase n=1 Tax=Sphingomonas sp. TaxID=28214 RepID=UPI002B9112CA|nr:gentisate 1,2-dioxygenase [Sphingomonas sp.]HMI19144.1 gentisate 1,2-dioxygenase [Sphingomonas sp.]
MSGVEDSNAALAQFSSEISSMDMSPLWEREPGAMAPGTRCVPHIWHYADVRPALMQSIGLISKRQAERRVLVLENPSLRGSTFIANSLYAGLQAIAPGEVAPSHRHTPNALRFLVEGEGGYTAVGGERSTMRPGDFVVTPNWAWHDHGNLGTGPVVWLDGLDTAIPKFFGATFREDHGEEAHPIVRSEGESLAAYGANMQPLTAPADNLHSPILLYPYVRSREALERLKQAGSIHSAHGAKLRYSNPVTGGHPFPTMAAFMQLLPDGFQGRRYRSTENAVFVVVEGHGVAEVEGRQLAFGPRDVFVVPAWSYLRFAVEEQAVLFSYSDRAAQEKLGFWREELQGENGPPDA